ncbi:hypothetical protein ABFT80_00135 [Mesorhizobium sp. SB112]|uniref:hypothetical protein n=1 Tax=Mesorhizobium sp. SB112 TaxID=3151853 RepID=UPI0032648C94
MRFRLTIFLGVLAWSGEALAHASERGHVLLLPTGHYLVGGALAVLASFLVLLLIPPAALDAIAAKRLKLFRVSDAPRIFVSLISFGVLIALVAAGLFGSRDPLSNPLPLVIWTLLWVGLSLVQSVFGNLWHWINPWSGPVRIVGLLTGKEAPFALAPRLAYWPAVALFFAFAWFELVYPAPSDPAILAQAVACYWIATFILMLAFGHEQWSARGEFLSVFFGMLSRFSIFERDEKGLLSLGWPGAKLWKAEALPLSGIAFLLLTLASVSFDGLSKTFFWLGGIGVNPLEYPGRSALACINTTGLLLAPLVLLSAYFLAVFIGEWLVSNRSTFRSSAGLLVWSIVPIAFAYHFSHYLTSLAVDGQYALKALSDPFALGWNLFGTSNMNVEAAIMMGHGPAWVVWNLQAAAIVGGHVLAVLVAHGLAFRLHPKNSDAVKSQIPLTVLMILYTVFGLWLLSTPTAG